MSCISAQTSCLPSNYSCKHIKVRMPESWSPRPTITTTNQPPDDMTIFCPWVWSRCRGTCLGRSRCRKGSIRGTRHLKMHLWLNIMWQISSGVNIYKYSLLLEHPKSKAIWETMRDAIKAWSTTSMEAVSRRVGTKDCGIKHGRELDRVRSWALG